MSYTSLLVSLILFTITLLVFGVYGYWLHLRVSRLELEAVNQAANRVIPLSFTVGGSTVGGVGGEPPMDFSTGLYEVPMDLLESQTEEDGSEADGEQQQYEENLRRLKEEVLGHAVEDVEAEAGQDHDDDRLPAVVEQVSSVPQTADAAEPSVHSEPATTSYEDLSVPKLKELCEERSIQVGRKDRKADIVAKLQHYDAEHQ